MRPIVILGTGMAGFGAARHLASEGIAFEIFDKDVEYGGHTRSYTHPGGWIFDDGPHVSLTKEDRVKEIFAEAVNWEYEEIPARLNNYWRGYWITHPAQVNLHGIPVDDLVKIISAFVDAQQKYGDREIRNYDDYCRVAYGDAFAEMFPLTYGRKYHTTTADNMTTEWLGPRMYRPSLEEVLRGALSPESTTEVHYVTSFRYPRFGGFMSYMRPWAEAAPLQLGHELVRLDPKAREAHFANGVVARYSQIISSVPLPDLIPMIDGVPDDIVAASRKLAATSVVMVNLGIGRDDLSTEQISYFYDEDIIFPRISYPHLLSRNVVPPGCGSIQVEVYFSDKYKPLVGSPQSYIEPVIHDLNRVGILREDDHILFREGRLAPYGNIIFDLDRPTAIAAVHGYLQDIGVLYGGRYGQWDHSWTDASFLSGERAAIAAIDAER